jgi:hypothetical protein
MNALSDTSYRVPSGTRLSRAHAILRAGSLLLAPPDSLTHLTIFALRSLPCDLGGLGIRRFGGLAGEIACLRGRTVLYEFAEKYTPRLLEGATLDF